MRHTTTSRVIDLTTLGSEPKTNGPDPSRFAAIDCTGYTKMSISARAITGTWSTGVVTLYGGVVPSERRALASALTLTNAAPHARAQSIAGDTFIVPQVSTAESGVLLEVTVHLYDDTGANG